MIAKKNPIFFKKLITILEEDSNQGYLLQQTIARALIEMDNKNNTLVHTILKHAPKVLNVLIMAMKKINEDQSLLSNNFGKTLKIKNSQGLTPLHLMAKNAPFIVESVIELISRHSSLMKSFADALVESNPDGQTGLHLIAKYAPTALSKLIDFISITNIMSTHSTGNPEEKKLNAAFLKLKMKFTQALMKQDKEGVTGLQMIAKSAPEVFKSIEDFLPVLNADPDSTDIFQEFARELEKIKSKSVLVEIDTNLSLFKQGKYNSQQNSLNKQKNKNTKLPKNDATFVERKIK